VISEIGFIVIPVTLPSVTAKVTKASAFIVLSGQMAAKVSPSYGVSALVAQTIYDFYHPNG
jgi:hypothetical protein